MKRTPLSQRDCARLKVGDPPLNDGHALSLTALSPDRKVWRYRYRLAGKPGSFTIGYWPAIELDEARALRDKAAAQVREGTAPILARKAEQQTQIEADTRTLGALVNAWIENRAQREQGLPGAWVPEHADNMRAVARRFILSHPASKLPIDRVEPLAMITLLNGVPGYARNSVRIILTKTFDRAISLKQTTLGYNPADIVREEITPPRRSVAHPAVREIEQARAILAAFEASAATPIAKLAHRFLALTALRISEATAIRWDWLHDLDGAAPTLHLPPEAMKGRRHGHTVPLAPQAVRVLLFARRYRRHRQDHVFLAPHDRQRGTICGRAIQIVLARVTPVPFVAHGWRSTFSTLMNRQYFAERAIIDQMLAHKPAGVSAVEAVYNRELHLERRRVIACAWADMLLEGATDLSAICGGEMVTIAAAA